MDSIHVTGLTTYEFATIEPSEALGNVLACSPSVDEITIECHSPTGGSCPAASTKSTPAYLAT